VGHSGEAEAIKGELLFNRVLSRDGLGPMRRFRGHGEGPVELYACRLDDVVTVTIVDHGQWRTPPADPGFRGRGLDLVRGLSNQADVTRSDHGTTVTMTWLLVAGTGGAVPS
jgi:hypothetical protein